MEHPPNHLLEVEGDKEYAVRVTANDGELGEQYLKEFQDNEKTIPTILTTSQKLSTGVDALNVRNALPRMLIVYPPSNRILSSTSLCYTSKKV